MRCLKVFRMQDNSLWWATPHTWQGTSCPWPHMLNISSAPYWTTDNQKCPSHFHKAPKVVTSGGEHHSSPACWEPLGWKKLTKAGGWAHGVPGRAPIQQGNPSQVQTKQFGFEETCFPWNLSLKETDCNCTPKFLIRCASMELWHSHWPTWRRFWPQVPVFPASKVTPSWMGWWATWYPEDGESGVCQAACRLCGLL